MKRITIDLETTGTDVKEDRIVSIAFIAFDPTDHKSHPVEKYSLINPEIPIPAEATKVHGITDSMVAGERTFAAIAKSLLAMLSHPKEVAFVGYNVRGFDAILLRNEFRRCGLELELEGRVVIDAMYLYHMANTRTLVDAVRQYCDPALADQFEGDAHNALADVRGTNAVLDAMIHAEDQYKGLDLQELHDRCDDHRKMVLTPWDEWFRESDPPAFQYGKHEGMLLSEAPRDYVQWMVRKVDDDDFTALVKQWSN